MALTSQKRHKLRIKQHRQRVQAKKRAQLDDPRGVTAPLTPRTLKRETKAAVRLRYGQEESALRGQVRASGQQQRNITDWYGQYQQAVEHARNATAEGYANAAAQIGQTANTSQASDQTARQQMIAKMQADAASRGATVDPTIAATGQQAEASRRTGLDEQQAATVRTGANQNAYLADVGRIGVGRTVQAHEQETSRKRAIKTQLAGLKGEKGDYAVQYRTNARNTERTNLATEAALGLKKKDLKQKIRQQGITNRQADARLSLTAAHNAALEAIAQQNANTSAGRARTARQQEAYKRRNHLGTYARPQDKKERNWTPASRTKAQNDLAKARNLLRAQRSALQGASASQVIAGLGNKGVPADIARAAYQYYYFGGVKPALRRRLARTYGIHTKKAGAKRHIQSSSDQGLGAVGQTLGGAANTIPKK